MLKITPNIINTAKKLKTADEQALSAMVERSKEVMAEFGTLFKSKTLEQLYTPEYHYQGIMPRSTYIIDKKTGKRKLIFIGRSTSSEEEKRVEVYTARSYGLRSLGLKSFATIAEEGRIEPGVMESSANHRYAGTQIRLTQVEVERAMQLKYDCIPLLSYPEALPFHTMMGFRPDVEYSYEVKSIADVEKELSIIINSSVIKKELFTPIIHYKDNKYYFDKNQTIANATLRHFKKEAENGVVRNYHSIFPGDDIDMTLSGKELEAWKQRALSQPILLKNKKREVIG